MERPLLQKKTFWNKQWTYLDCDHEINTDIFIKQPEFESRVSLYLGDVTTIHPGLGDHKEKRK